MAEQKTMQDHMIECNKRLRSIIEDLSKMVDEVAHIRRYGMNDISITKSLDTVQIVLNRVRNAQ